MNKFGQIALVFESVAIFILKEMHLGSSSESEVFFVVIARQSNRLFFLHEQRDNVEMMNEIQNDGFEFCNFKTTNSWQ